MSPVEPHQGNPEQDQPPTPDEAARLRTLEQLRSLGLDCCVLGGLSAMGTGLWWERPSLALIVVGSIVFTLGVRRL